MKSQVFVYNAIMNVSGSVFVLGVFTLMKIAEWDDLLNTKIKQSCMIEFRHFMCTSKLAKPHDFAHSFLRFLLIYIQKDLVCC